MATPFLSLLPRLLLLNILLSSLRCSAQNGLLQESEANALYDVASKLNVDEKGSYDQDACEKHVVDDTIRCKCAIDVTMREAPRNICVVTTLDFSNKKLDGKISPAVGNLSYLTLIDLSGNKLHGEIPNTLAKLLRLEKLDLSFNQLDGPIPNIFGKIQSLTHLDLTFNFLEGHIPPSLGALPNLTYLDLSLNKLTGHIPAQIGNITSLVEMYLEDNQLSGTIPPQLGKLGNLERMRISENNFTGKLPDEFEKLTKLELFDILGNDLSGPVPDFIAKWTRLRYLFLMGNKFEGVLPNGVFKLKQLESLWVTDLNVTADSSFPALPESSKLTSLILRNCSIVGEIPKNITLMDLRNLDLSFNKLAGEIPSSLQKLNFLGLSRNNFSGAFPDWIMDSSQKYRDFSYNHFNKASSYNSSYYVNTFTPTELPSDSSVQIMNRRCPKHKWVLGNQATK